VEGDGSSLACDAAKSGAFTPQPPLNHSRSAQHPGIIASFRRVESSGLAHGSANGNNLLWMRGCCRITPGARGKPRESRYRPSGSGRSSDASPDSSDGYLDGYRVASGQTMLTHKLPCFTVDTRTSSAPMPPAVVVTQCVLHHEGGHNVYPGNHAPAKSWNHAGRVVMINRHMFT
jgi:hypothetical protein